MDQYELIRTAKRVYGKSIRQIARDTGHHRVTIRKALAGREPKYRRRLQAFLLLHQGLQKAVRFQNSANASISYTPPDEVEGLHPDLAGKIPNIHGVTFLNTFR
ncbi:hypothetical protein MYX82_02355 [Acidobacteria bacterium AH-259-D05]|nr:hypothetical protein [Acidobacteria bacterium AH-259-D05]